MTHEVASAIFEVALLHGISRVCTSNGSRAPMGMLTSVNVLNRSQDRQVEFEEIDS